MELNSTYCLTRDIVPFFNYRSLIVCNFFIGEARQAASAGGDSKAIKGRKIAETLMTSAQIAEAQQRASAWVAKHQHQ